MVIPYDWVPASKYEKLKYDYADLLRRVRELRGMLSGIDKTSFWLCAMDFDRLLPEAKE